MEAAPSTELTPTTALADLPTWAANTQPFVVTPRLDGEEDAQFAPSRPFTPSDTINLKVSLWRGDITKLEVDAIVNAARPSLLGGGGIDKAIHRAAGPGLLEECRTLGGCRHGQCKVTSAYELPCRLVLHTVGPNRDLHNDEVGYPLLKASYQNCLGIVLEHDIKSVALSCVSTGAYRFPARPAAHVALSTVRKWLESNDNLDAVERIVFVTFLESDELIYKELMHAFYFPLPAQTG